MAFDLDQRLADVPASALNDLLRQLNGRKFERAANPNNPYYKYNLQSAVGNRLDNEAPTGLQFHKTLASTINKEELKRVFYGQVAMGAINEGVEDVLNCLNDWEKAMFFAGSWASAYRTLEDLQGKDLTNTVADLIKAGYDLIHGMHMQKFRRGTYKRSLKLPGSQDYHETARNEGNPLYQQFATLLRSEKRAKYSTASQRKIATFLLQCTPDQIQHLTHRFGSKYVQVPQRPDEVIDGYGALLRQEDAAGKIRDMSQREDALMNIHERQGIFLDSCSLPELVRLTRFFGAHKLGGYAVRPEDAMRQPYDRPQSQN